MLDRKVIFETSTEGVSTQKKDIDFFDVFGEAFRTATVNLLADRGFHAIVVGTGQLQESSFDPLEIGNARHYEKPINHQIDNVRRAVVTVLAGPAHGSGFFIDKGLVLTNAHVIDKTSFIKIKMLDGKEARAELLRLNRKRDIALLKVENDQEITALPLLLSDVGVGSDVYAVGSPLDEKWSETVSKGVISGYRNENGIKLIQSDVNILPGNSGGPLLDQKGNVVGVSQSGIFISAAPSGINFFIPITDALSALNIKTK